MNELDGYGSPDYRYEGVGQIRSARGDVTAVYFDARQLTDSEIVVGCFSTDGYLPSEAVELTGHTENGKAFTTSGDLTALHQHISSTINSAVYHCQSLSVDGSAPESAPYTLRFALHNLALAQDDRPRAPRHFNVDSFEVTIGPHVEYEARIRRLRTAGGFYQTAWCDVKAAGGTVQVIAVDAARAVVDQLLNPLSLASGSLVSWHCFYVLGLGNNDVRATHATAISRPFTNLVMGRGWHTDLVKASQAWFDADAHLQFTSEELRGYIRQHLEACVDEPFLETRGLSAATLLDVMAGRHAQLTHSGEIMSSTKWRDTVLPALRKAIDGLEDFGNGVRDEIYLNLANQHRRTFRFNLHRLLTDLAVLLDEPILSAAIKTRNRLVHSGIYPDARGAAAGRNDHATQFFRLLLISRCVLLHACGVPNDLHTLISTPAQPRVHAPEREQVT